MLSAPSRLGLLGGKGLRIPWSDGVSTLRCASSGGACAGSFTGGAGRGNLIMLGVPDAVRRAGCVSPATEFNGVLSGTAFLAGTDRRLSGLIVEFEEEDDDSRTSGSPIRVLPLS